MRTYSSRIERVEFLQTHFGAMLVDRVLDVGCDAAHLRSLLSESCYTGIDIQGFIDVKVDLEDGAIPFRSNSFDCVLCLDVLEHLEQIHAVFAELVRVSSKHVIISLPNPFALYWPLFLKAGGSADKYGLPVVPPPDRHRWFFDYLQAKQFVHTMSQKNGAEVVQIKAVPLASGGIWWKAKLKAFLKRIMATSQERYLNVSTQAIWAVLRKL